jgi:hypothetical protein
MLVDVLDEADTYTGGGADRISQRFDLQKSKLVYSDIDEFVTDVGKIEHEMIRGLMKAGCRDIYIDAPGYTAYIDPPSLKQCASGAKIRAKLQPLTESG